MGQISKRLALCCDICGHATPLRGIKQCLWCNRVYCENCEGELANSGGDMCEECAETLNKAHELVAVDSVWEIIQKPE